jgi:hypothetical protein
MRLYVWALLVMAACLGGVVSACSSDDEAGDPDLDPIAWVSPSPGSSVAAGEPIELSAKVNDARATAVRFTADGRELSTCERSDECRRGELFRFTTTFDVAGRRRLVASYTVEGVERTASVDLEVTAKTSSATLPDGGDAGVFHAPDGGKDAAAPPPPPPPVNRGFLDPDRPLHNVFGGVSWDVKSQKVGVVNPPAGSVTAVAACMQKYGASIRKHADAFKMSRASVVATAITESNCTNPAGSSDGLSSGPMQVTGSTCASVAGGGISSSACKTKMYQSPDFSFYIGTKYMASSYQLNQHGHDAPKIAAAYNAGSIRSSTLNRWHMVVTGNHLERYVGAYNAYRAWESSTGVAKLMVDTAAAARPEAFFAGEHVSRVEDLPSTAAVGQVYFVGDWDARDGVFVTFRDGRWETD